jgi:hypothetical protein
VSEEQNVILAHQGPPFDPPEVQAAGGVVSFRDAGDGIVWLGKATEEQAAELTRVPSFTRFGGQVPAQPPAPPSGETQPVVEPTAATSTEPAPAAPVPPPAPAAPAAPAADPVPTKASLKSAIEEWALKHLGLTLDPASTKGEMLAAIEKAMVPPVNTAE